jgi:hypothetical protein
MKRFTMVYVVMMLYTCCGTSAWALDSLDALLPTPYLLRSRADDLNIPTETLAQINQSYKTAEPKYHELKRELDDRTQRFYTMLVDSQFNNHFDAEAIVTQMKGVLQAETNLKLYQVRVRVTLLSHVTVEQRQQARNYASEKAEEAKWRGDVLADGELNTLLPKPFWLRSRASEVGVDIETRGRLEHTYQALVPVSHILAVIRRALRGR